MLSKPQGLVRPKGLGKFKKSTSSGIEPATFPFVEEIICCLATARRTGWEETAIEEIPLQIPEPLDVLVWTKAGSYDVWQVKMLQMQLSRIMTLKSSKFNVTVTLDTINRNYHK
jgi:hypothetical protein